MKKYIILVFFILISGIISALSSSDIWRPMWMPFILPMFLPGLVFGILTGIYFRKFNGLKTNNIIWYVALSTLAYFSAFNVARYLHIATTSFGDGSNASLNGDLIHFVIAGGTGALMLAFGVSYLIRKMKIWQLVSVVLIGGVLGIIFQKTLIPEFITWWKPQSAILAFILWQLGVGLALALFIDRK